MHKTLFYNKFIISLYYSTKRLRWSRGSVLAFSTQVRGFKPGRSRRIFRAKKILRTPSFGGEVKPSVPCRTFVACKRSINLSGSRNLGKNYRSNFSQTVSPFAARISRVVADVQALGGESGNV
jgi:hypothetical protein